MLTNERILFKKIAHRCYLLKITFGSCTEDRMTHFNISVVINDAEIIRAS